MTATTPAASGLTDRNLNAGLAHTVQEITRTDGKAGQLLALDGLLVAALSFLGSDARGASLALAIVGAVALVASVVLALLAVRPRLNPAGGPDKASFVHWATASVEEIEAGLREDRQVSRLRVLSQIAMRKMRMLRLSGDAALAAVVTIAAAILAR